MDSCPFPSLMVFSISSCQWLRPNILRSCFTSTPNLSADPFGLLSHILKIWPLLNTSAVSTLVKTPVAIHLACCCTQCANLSPSFCPGIPHPLRTQSHLSTAARVILLSSVLHHVLSWHSYPQSSALRFLLIQNNCPGGHHTAWAPSSPWPQPLLFSCCRLLQPCWPLVVLLHASHVPFSVPLYLLLPLPGILLPQIPQGKRFNILQVFFMPP